METRGPALLFALLAAFAAHAERYRFRHFGPDDGLNTAVGSLLQDRAGFLWVGTGNGLFRYDGAHFQRYGAAEGLPSPSIRRLAEGPDGTIWVLTGRGLARSDRNSFRAVHTGADGYDFRALAISRDGKLFLGFDKGLLVGSAASGADPPEFGLVPGAPHEQVNGILADANGSVWFGCGVRLCLLEQGRSRVFDRSYGLPEEHWGVMLRDRVGNLWLRGPQHLYMLPRGEARFQARDKGLPQSSNTALSVLEDGEGHLLVATDHGIARWSGISWEMIGMGQGLQSETVTALLEDREGSLWIGLWGSGVVRWPHPAEWTNWTTADGLASDIVWAIRRDLSGTVWLGTDRGLVHLRDSPMAPQLFTSRDGLAGDKVKSLAIGPDGAIWAACLPGGVSRVDPRSGKMRVYSKAAGLEDDRVIAVHVDLEDRLWAATSEGLFRSDSLGPKLRFTRQLPPGTTPHTMFFRFLTDREGRLWVGSNQGLFRFDGQSWQRYTTAHGLKADAVTHLAQTADGAIWVAYREALGISRLVAGPAGVEASHVGQSDGLPSDYVLFFGVDARGQLWAGTDNGVAVLSNGEWSVHTHEDGLAWDDCAANAFLADPDGAVWLGSLRGLSRYRPTSRVLPYMAPPVVVTGARFGERTVDPNVRSDVLFRDRNFSATFAGLSFLSERTVRFRYRMEGLDDRWVETSDREARYPGLGPGDYRFQVASRRGTGSWSAVPAVVSFRIVPPWWDTHWFRAFGAGFLALLAMLMVRTRLKRIRHERRRLESAVRERTAELQLQKLLVERQKQEIEELLARAHETSRLKSEFLANMSHEIRTPMNGVIGLTQLALQTNLDAEQRDYISTVRDSAESLLVIINDILDFSKIEAGKMELCLEPFCLPDCINAALAVFSWKAQEKGLRLSCAIDEHVPEMIGGDAGRLRQILLNLLGNAVKFTAQGEISLWVTAEPGPDVTLHFEVRDTGIGIPPERQEKVFQSFTQGERSSRGLVGTGLGLAICSKLVNLMHGRIWVESAPGEGSTFHFTAKFDPVLAQSPLALPQAGDALALPAASLSILLAEDNLVNQKLAVRALEKMGHCVQLACDGVRAVEAAGKQAYDLILMDLQMPEMDGFGAMTLIRERDAIVGRRTPIIALTAHAIQGDRENCLRAGFDDYISKPIDLRELARVVGKVRVRQAPETELPHPTSA